MAWSSVEMNLGKAVRFLTGRMVLRGKKGSHNSL
jgi:hypothetical protein